LPSGNVREICAIGKLLVGLAPTERPVAGYVCACDAAALPDRQAD
jgi:hypothetical protein